MSDKRLQSVVEKIIKKYYSGLPVEYICALDLFTHGIRESDFSKSGDLNGLNIPDDQRISIMNALRDIERNQI
ncbi:MAG: hypothetical protein ACOC80_09600 [Petrotogales bacterium]